MCQWAGSDQWCASCFLFKLELQQKLPFSLSSFRSNFCFLSSASLCHWKHWWPHFHVGAALGKRKTVWWFCLTLCVHACTRSDVSLSSSAICSQLCGWSRAYKIVFLQMCRNCTRAEVLASNRPVLLCRPKAAQDKQGNYVFFFSFPGCEGLNLHLCCNLSTSTTINHEASEQLWC